MTVTETIREAVLADDRSIRQVGIGAGIEPNVAALFARGRGLQSRTLDKLASHLGFTLVRTVGQ